MKAKLIALVMAVMTLSACGYDSHVYHSNSHVHTVHYVHHTPIVLVHHTVVHHTVVHHTTVHRTIVSKSSRMVTSKTSRPTVSLRKR